MLHRATSARSGRSLLNQFVRGHFLAIRQNYWERKAEGPHKLKGSLGLFVKKARRTIIVRRLNGFLGLSLNDRTIPFLVILLDKTVSVVIRQSLQ